MKQIDPIYQRSLPQGLFSVYLDQPDFPVHQVKQVHGDKVIEIALAQHKMGAPAHGEADGLSYLWQKNQTETELKLAIKTADCLPICILGHKGVALLHAGWRGVEQKIVLAPEVAKLEPYFSFIGPHIKACCFEVQPDFKNQFPQSRNFYPTGAKLYFDLQAEVRQQLQSAYGQQTIISAAHCTVCSSLKFNSYRRDKTPQRNWNVWHFKL